MLFAAVFLFLQAGLLLSEVRCAYTNVKAQNVLGPKNFGVESTGFVSLQDGHSRLVQNCDNLDPKNCGEIEGGIMSSFTIKSGGAVTQAATAAIRAGNYSYINVDSGCDLTIDHQSGIEPEGKDGGGRTEIYCTKSHFTLDGNTFIKLDRQTKIMVYADFTIASEGMVQMQRASTLAVYYPFAMENLVWLILHQSSTFNVTQDAKGIISISSSKAGLTRVILEASASVFISGDFTVGKGAETVTMTVQTSGSLIVSNTGDFEVSTGQFDIGPSSFWQINGIFNLDQTSTFGSGMQSNLTVNGTMITTDGGLSIAPFSSITILGYYKCEAGSMSTSEFSQLTIGPTDKQKTYGSLTLNGGTVALDHYTSFTVMGSVVSNSKLTLNKFAEFFVGVSNILTLNAEGSLVMGLGSSFSAQGTGAGTISGVFTLGQRSSANIIGSFTEQTNTNVTIGSGSIFNVYAGGNLQLNGPGSLTMGSMSTFSTNSAVTISGHATVESGAVFTVDSGANIQLNSPGSLTIGPTSKFSTNGAVTISGVVMLQSGSSLVSQSNGYSGNSFSTTQTGNITLEQGSSLSIMGSGSLSSAGNILLGQGSSLDIEGSLGISASGAGLNIGKGSKFNIPHGTSVNIMHPGTKIQVGQMSYVTFKASFCIALTDVSIGSFQSITIPSTAIAGFQCF